MLTEKKSPKTNLSAVHDFVMHSHIPTDEWISRATALEATAKFCRNVATGVWANPPVTEPQPEIKSLIEALGVLQLKLEASERQRQALEDELRQYEAQR